MSLEQVKDVLNDRLKLLETQAKDNKQELNSKPTILFTDGSTNIGSHITEYLKSRDAEISFKIVDIRTIPKENLPNWFQGIPTILEPDSDPKTALDAIYRILWIVEKVKSPKIRTREQGNGMMKVRKSRGKRRPVRKESADISEILRIKQTCKKDFKPIDVEKEMSRRRLVVSKNDT